MRWLVALVILGSLARMTTAEINAADTVEWIAADADVIVVGKVDRVVKRGPAWYDVTISVDDVVKGTPRGSVTFRAHHASGGPAPTWQAPRASGTPVLVFLVHARRYVRDDRTYQTAKLALRTGPSTPGLYDLGGPAPAYTAGFDVIKTRDELLAATRSAAKSAAKQAYRVDAPWSSAAHNSLYAGSTVWIYVPVDAALEKRAHGWLSSKDLWQREQAAGALVHFKSVANAKRLEALLSDPGFAEVSESGKPTVRRYLVRAKAHEILTAWRIPHVKPVIDEPKP